MIVRANKKVSRSSKICSSRLAFTRYTTKIEQFVTYYISKRDYTLNECAITFPRAVDVKHCTVTLNRVHF